jgi:hypothetical protein
MSIGRMLVVFTLLLPCRGPIFGSDDANALPADGAWVRYRTASKSADGMIDYAGELTIRVVGRKMDRVGPCRWVELQFVGNEIEKDAKSIYKLLIPERALLKESKPWQHVVRAWVKYDDGDVAELAPAFLNGGDPNGSIVLSDELLFWPGVLQQAKKTAKPVTVEFRQARLNIPEGFAGQHVGEFPSLTSDAKRVDTTEFQMWFHRDVPFGFAFARMQTKSVGGDGPDFPSLTTEYSVVDTGSDAKSSLPEND